MNSTVQKKITSPSGNILTADTVLFEGVWTHLFGPGLSETTCRIVIDVTNNKLIAAQAPSSDGRSWIGLRADAKSDLAESLFDANHVSTNPAEFGLVEIESLPDWATALVSSQATLPDQIAAPSAGNARKVMQRRMALHALDAAIRFATDIGLVDELAAKCANAKSISDMSSVVQNEVRNLFKPA
jgi:hypothetical protein